MNEARINRAVYSIGLWVMGATMAVGCHDFVDWLVGGCVSLAFWGIVNDHASERRSALARANGGGDDA